MKNLFLAAATAIGLTALAASGAIAAPLPAGVHVAPAPGITQVDYYWHHHHWHHRHWDHRHWHYYD